MRVEGLQSEGVDDRATQVTFVVDDGRFVVLGFNQIGDGQQEVVEVSNELPLVGAGETEDLRVLLAILVLELLHGIKVIVCTVDCNPLVFNLVIDVFKVFEGDDVVVFGV